MLINPLATKIDLSNKGLHEFPIELLSCKNLKKLNLSNNHLKSLPKGIDKLKRLEVLDVSYNQLNVLYSNTFNLKKLEVLILKNNKVKKLPKQIKNLQYLKNLNIANNNLIELPKELVELPYLEELNISGNYLDVFPPCILNLQNLKNLWLNNNNFKDFPGKEILNNLKKLKALYCYSLAKNSLEKLNKDYLALTSIQGNSLKYLEGVLSTSNATKDMLNDMRDQPVNKNKIFISYSHKDDGWFRRVEASLKALQIEKRLNNLEVNLDYWSDTRIIPGQEWEKEIQEAINEAYIAILIFSNQFLASDFITTKEIPWILKNAEKHNTKVLSLIASPCRFSQIEGVSKFQGINGPSEPLSGMTFHEQENALVRLSSVVSDYIR